MKYTADEVIQFVEEENVKFIRLAFCDIYGRQKNISIMPGELRRAFSDGMAFDASAIAGFGGAVRSDSWNFCQRWRDGKNAERKGLRLRWKSRRSKEGEI